MTTEKDAFAPRGRRHVVAAFAAYALLLLLAPIQSLIWNKDAAPGWVKALGPLHGAANAFHSVAAPLLGAEPYEAFGRLLVIVYAGLFAAIYLTRPAEVRTQPVVRTVVLAAFAVAALADVVAYWVAGLGNPQLRFYAFWITEVPALAICILSLATLGALRLRARAGATWVNALLIATPVLAFGATAAVQYMPHGLLLGIGIAACALALDDAR
jgi:hypothetical protein